LLEDQNSVATETQNDEVEIDDFKAKLAEQTKKANELEKQVEQLKAVIRQVQIKLEQQAAEQQAEKHEANESPAPKL
jgi:peptidoglycan hydrolase CwlO-like protein